MKNTSLRKHAHLVFNPKSGKGGASALSDEAAEICKELGVELHLHPLEHGKNFDKIMQDAVEATIKDNGVVIAAGGDGTIRGVAQVAHATDVTFAVVACGTFNYFARTHRIPEDSAEAFRLALTGEVRPVRLGVVNDSVFLINASLGLYVQSIRDREQRTKKYGRNRIVAVLSTFISFFTHRILMKVDLETEGKVYSMRTPTIFIGNNALQLRNLKLDVAKCMRSDLLAAVIMRPLERWEILRIFFRGLTKTLDNEDRLTTFCVSELKIHTRKSLQQVALDGELIWARSPLKIAALPKTLNMVLPPKETST